MMMILFEKIKNLKNKSILRLLFSYFFNEDSCPLADGREDLSKKFLDRSYLFLIIPLSYPLLSIPPLFILPLSYLSLYPISSSILSLFLYPIYPSIPLSSLSLYPSILSILSLPLSYPLPLFLYPISLPLSYLSLYPIYLSILSIPLSCLYPISSSILSILSLLLSYLFLYPIPISLHPSLRVKLKDRGDNLKLKEGRGKRDYRRTAVHKRERGDLGKGF